MTSVFDQIIEEDRNAFLQSFEEATRSLEKELNLGIEAFNKYVQTGDDTEVMGLLGKEEKENLIRSVTATTKPKRRGTKALTDLSVPVSTEDNLIKVKIEKDIMPAPTELPLKKRIKKEPVENKTEELPKRSTRTKTKQKNMQEMESQEKRPRPSSDVIIQEKPIPTIEVPEESESETEAPKTRQTRTKKKQTENETKLDGTFTVPKKNNLEAEPLPTRSTRTKTLKKNNVQETAEAKKDDELKTASDMSKEVEKVDSADTTYVAETKKTDNNSEKNPAVQSTPAADKTVVIEKPVVTKNNNPETATGTHSPERKLKKNEVFSPYKKTPLKDKVAAFENLRKTPASESKNQTPALVRKCTMLKIQSEEIKKKRELKQQRAQLLREMNEKEKKKNLEMLKKKDEKMKNVEVAVPKKQILASDPSKIINKKLQPSYSSSSSSTQSNRALQQTVKKPKLDNKMPLYMTTPMPLLPTEDCYDSDDEKSRKLVKRPAWSRESYLTRTLQVMDHVGESLKNTLFCRTTHTPDLLELFEYVHPTKLKRNSSAVWRSPPRYTLFSVTRDIHFSDDEGDDE